MQSLDQSQAQIIVDRLMEDIPYNINIMDRFGKIIASGDKKRIRQQHYAAEQAIKTKDRIDVFKDSRYAKKGTNEPIVYKGELLGVVGISGEPNEVGPFTKIVSSIVYLLVQEMQDYRYLQKMKNQKNCFLNQLLDYNSSENYSDSLVSQGLVFYQLNLLVDNRCVLSQNKDLIRDLAGDCALFHYKDFYSF